MKGISVFKCFREPTSKVNRNELKGYKIVKPNDIAFVQTTHNEKVFAFAHNNTKENMLVSWSMSFYGQIYRLLPEYLSLFLMRKDFDRYARFHSWGSAREIFSIDDLKEVSIPIPDIKIQQSIAAVHNSYLKRKSRKTKNANQQHLPHSHSRCYQGENVNGNSSKTFQI